MAFIKLGERARTHVKRMISKDAVQRIVDQKDQLMAEAKRQIQLLNWTISVMDYRLSRMSEERKWLILAIIVLACTLLTLGVCALA